MMSKPVPCSLDSVREQAPVLGERSTCRPDLLPDGPLDEVRLTGVEKGRAGHSVKRLLDTMLSGIGLVLSSPLWLGIGLAIRMEGGGPVFYGQERVGEAGRKFWSWKFRSMIPDSDERFGPLQARDGDRRVTQVGRFLRATALDELPQLWNILRGDMSFVGPRALLPGEIEVNGNGEFTPLEKIPGYEARHRVRPGLTGLAQVYAPRDILRQHKFKYDLLYIKRQSFSLDMKLILLSFWITLRGKWEHRGKKF
jgi:lipopolysaccharide/colanic/teichoic acid biosynthesis glycosyltransferase